MVTFAKEQKCLKKNQKTEYFYISILTSVSLAACNPTIRAFRSEVSKHLPANVFGMLQNGLKRVLLNIIMYFSETSLYL